MLLLVPAINSPQTLCPLAGSFLDDDEEFLGLGCLHIQANGLSASFDSTRTNITLADLVDIGMLTLTQIRLPTGRSLIDGTPLARPGLQ